MGQAKGLQGGTAGEFPLVEGALQAQPGEVIQHGLADVPLPAGEEAARHLVPVPLVEKAHQEVQVEVRLTGGGHGQKGRLKAVVSRPGPDDVHGPALLGTEIPGLHGVSP